MNFIQDKWLDYFQLVERLRITPNDVDEFIKNGDLDGYIVVNGEPHKIDDPKLSYFAVYNIKDIEKLESEFGNKFKKQDPEDIKIFADILRAKYSQKNNF